MPDEKKNQTVDFSKLFTNKKSTPPVQDVSPAQKNMEEINRDLIRRLRVVEERYTNLRKNIQINEQNTINEIKKTKKTLRLLSDDIKDMKHNMRDFAEELKHVIKELSSTAKREEVKVIDRYLNFLDPLNFLSKKEVERLVKEKIEERFIAERNSNGILEEKKL